MNAVLAYKAGKWLLKEDGERIIEIYVSMTDNINEIYVVSENEIPTENEWEYLGFRFKKNTGKELIDTVVSLRADYYIGFTETVVNGKEKNLHIFCFD